MRKIILMMTIAVLSLSQTNAQIKEGKLIFERKINMYRMITDPEMRRNIPEFRTEKFELIFNDQATVFKTIPNEDAPDPFANSGGPGGGGGTRGMNFMFRMPETNTYTDIASQMQYEARTIFENEYLIVDTLKPNSWKLSDETKTIANYVCKKATTTVAPMAFSMRFGSGDRRGGGGRNADDTTKQADRKPKEIQLVVWYTEAIPLSIGPDTYSGLPGAILEVDSDNGSNVISALNYIPKYSPKELKQPTKGKKLNRAQFQTEMQTIMKDFQRGGGFGGIRISAGN